jgi:hypothetical protein
MCSWVLNSSQPASTAVRRLGAVAGSAGQVGQVAAEGVVEDHHQRQVQVAGRVAGHRRAVFGRATNASGVGGRGDLAAALRSNARNTIRVWPLLDITSP